MPNERPARRSRRIPARRVPSAEACGWRARRRRQGHGSAFRSLESLLLRLDGDRQPNLEDGTGAVRAVRGCQGSLHRLDEAAADTESEPGARTHLVLLFRPMKLVEDSLRVLRRKPRPFVDDPQAGDIPDAPRLEPDLGA